MTGPLSTAANPAPRFTSCPTLGLSLADAVTAANPHDSNALEPLGQAIPAIRSRRGRRRHRPAKLHADNAYDHPHLRTMLTQRGITPRIERTITWLFGSRRLTTRYGRTAKHFAASPHARRSAHLLQHLTK